MISVTSCDINFAKDQLSYTVRQLNALKCAIICALLKVYFPFVSMVL